MHSNHTEEGAPSASASEQSDPLAEARALIAKDSQERMQACAAEIEEVLARHGMRLDVTPAQIAIVPV
ncbi:hypothetical protein ABZ636_03965 [Streptomyces sp. NPDC007251]|uniref:hypothetical protein n=1 Tax=Streptomyces sp. NPDC007251 TaxID=3154483 RepID=UPI0033CAA365